MKNYKNEMTQSLVISENSIFSYDSLSYCHHKHGNDGNNCTGETGTIKPSYSLHQRKGFPRCHGLWFGRLLFFLEVPPVTSNGWYPWQLRKLGPAAADRQDRDSRSVVVLGPGLGLQTTFQGSQSRLRLGGILQGLVWTDSGFLIKTSQGSATLIPS